MKAGWLAAAAGRSVGATCQRHEARAADVLVEGRVRVQAGSRFVAVDTKAVTVPSSLVDGENA